MNTKETDRLHREVLWHKSAYKKATEELERVSLLSFVEAEYELGLQVSELDRSNRTIRINAPVKAVVDAIQKDIDRIVLARDAAIENYTNWMLNE